MKFRVGNFDNVVEQDALVLLLAVGEVPTLPPTLVSIQATVETIVACNDFEGKFKESLGFRLSNPLGQVNKVVLIGLGSKAEVDSEKLRKLVACAYGEVKRLKSKTASVILPEGTAVTFAEQTKVMTESFLMSMYSFDTYQGEKKPTGVTEVSFIVTEDDLAEAKEGIVEGQILGETTVLARQLVNEPANVMTPENLGEEVAKIGQESGFEVEVFAEEKITALGMTAFLEVARAAANRPRLIVMRYFGDTGNTQQLLGLVGKGLTFDSGGLSVKPTESMVYMKCDMGGAAATIGAMSAIARLGLKINVIAVVAACENMIAGKGYRPGDIIQTMAGKTVFIGNTDAEGRLTLADAVHYIVAHEGVAQVVDIATLTGAAVIALGHSTSLVVTNNQELYASLEKASQVSGEKVWQMPSFPEYQEMLKSKVADLTNSAGRAGSSITAGLFIGEFVQKKPWLHIDIAGTAWTEKPEDYISLGGTGVGVRLLYHLVKELS